MAAVVDWTVDEVSEWLRSQNLHGLVEPFEENYVDGQLLLELDEEMLEELGISSKLQRKRFLLRVQEVVEGKGTAKPDKKAPSPARPQPTQTKVLRNTQPAQSAQRTRSVPTGSRFAQRALDAEQPPSLAALEQEMDDAVYMAVTPAGSTQPAAAVDDAGYMDLGEVRAARESNGRRGLPPAPVEEDQYMELAHETVHENLESATLTNLDAFQKAMDHLSNMFPTAGRPVLEQALKVNKGNVDKAVDHCLAAEFARFDASHQGSPGSARPAPHQIAKDSDADWLHDYISRDVAEDLLRQGGFTEGLFLIRRSTSVDGAFVLSLVVSREVKHHIIYAAPNRFEIFDIVCPSLTDLVGHLSDYQPGDGWHTPLQMHVPRAAALHNEEFSDYASIPGQRVTASINRDRAQSVHTSRSVRPQRAGRSHPGMPPSRPSPARTSSAPVNINPQAHMAPSFNFTRNDARKSMKSSRSPSTRGRTDAYQFRPQDFDLDPSSPSMPYQGDMQWPTAAHESSEMDKLGLTGTGAGRQPCAIKTLQTGMQILLAVDGPILGNIAYSLVESMAADRQVVRLVVGSGHFMGVYYFDAVDAATAKQICKTVEANTRNAMLAEDRRIAQLMQNEEFVAQVQAHPELAVVMQHSQSSSASASQKSKARAALGRFASRFRRSRSPKGERPDPLAVAANTPALVPPPQAQSFENPKFNLTRPGDPLPAVPGSEGYDQEEDDVWNLDPSQSNYDPSYAEVGPASGDIGVEPSYMTESVVDDNPFAEPPGDFGTAPALDSDLPVYRAIRRRDPEPYDPTALYYEVGDEIYVTEQKSGGHWEGVCHGKTGHFPAIDVEIARVSTADGVEVVLSEPGYGEQPPPFEAPFQRY
eukprot:m.117901 g.117901  ORF g.117901 m.117901 type:complete len:870 (-) comp15555_c0_seq3:93-2702(-)